MTSVLGFASNFNQEVESPAIYRPPPRTAIVSRETVKYSPEGKATYKAGDTIRIKVDADGFLDGSMSYLSMDVTMIEVENRSMFSPDIQTLFNRVRILDSNQNVLEDIADYNLLHRMLTEATLDRDQRQTEGAILMGIPPTSSITDPTARKWAESGVPRTYCVQLLSGVIMGGLSGKYYPTAHNGLIIEIDLEQDVTALRSDDVTIPAGIDPPALPLIPATYEVGTVTYVADIVKFDPEYEATFNARWVNEGVVYPYSTYTSFFQNLNSSSERIRVSENLSSLKTVYGGARLTADITQIRVDSFDTLHDPSAGHGSQPPPAAPTDPNTTGHELQDYQFKHLNNYFPKQVVRASGSGAEAFSELQKALGQHGNSLLAGDLDQQSYTLDGVNVNSDGNMGTGGKFMIGQEFERSATHVSGLRSKNGPLDLIVRYGGDQTGSSMNVYVHFDRLAILSVRGISLED